LMITYLPIFSGSDPRPDWAFARVVERLLVKGNRALRTSFDFSGARILGQPELNCDLGRGSAKVLVTGDAGGKILAVERPRNARTGSQIADRGQR
jgi:hypothetical protein